MNTQPLELRETFSGRNALVASSDPAAVLEDVPGYEPPAPVTDYSGLWLLLAVLVGAPVCLGGLAAGLWAFVYVVSAAWAAGGVQ